MSFSLHFHMLVLDDLQEMLRTYSKFDNDPDDFFLQQIQKLGQHIDSISHASGYGESFERQLKGSASQYFSEPNLFALLLDRKNIFPYTRDLEWGYLKLTEINELLFAAKNKKLSSIAGDDPEEFTAVLKKIFIYASEKNADIISIYQ